MPHANDRIRIVNLIPCYFQFIEIWDWKVSFYNWYLFFLYYMRVDNEIVIINITRINKLGMNVSIISNETTIQYFTFKYSIESHQRKLWLIQNLFSIQDISSDISYVLNPSKSNEYYIWGKYYFFYQLFSIML